MTEYFSAGDRVVYHSRGGDKCEPGVVVDDTVSGLVFVDYGRGRVMSTHREDLTREDES